MGVQLLKSSCYDINETALLRHRILLHVKCLCDSGCSLAEAMRLTSNRKWPDDKGFTYAVRTIESWWYSFKNRGFDAIVPVARSHSRILSDIDRTFLDRLLTNDPGISGKKLYASLLCNCTGHPRQPSYYSVLAYWRKRHSTQPVVVPLIQNNEWDGSFRDVAKTEYPSFSGCGKALYRFGVLSCIALIMESGHSLHDAFCQVVNSNLFGHRKKKYSVGTLEGWWYGFINKGACALTPKARSDRDDFRVLKLEDRRFLEQLISDRPDTSLKKAHALLLKQQANLSSKPPSYSTVINYFSKKGLNLESRELLKKSSAILTIRDDESWMQNILQGRTSVGNLIADLNGNLSDAEIAEAYHQVINGALKLRNRAIALLSASKGIKPAVIQNFLGVSVNYTDQLMQRFRARGIVGSLTIKPRDGPHKHELRKYHDILFTILHSPPSAYGINRTSWKMKDLHLVMAQQGYAICITSIQQIIRAAGYTVRKAKKVLTSNDPKYTQKLTDITSILRNLKHDEKFFSVDEYGPFAVRVMGGKSLMGPDEFKVIPQWQKSKGSLILTAGLELSENLITHFYSEHKNTEEMLKLLDLILSKYNDQRCIYFSWDAASWHASKKLYQRVDEINSAEYRSTHRVPEVKLAPLPSCAQFLNVIESVFSGMAKAIIHNSNYQSVDEAKTAIDLYFLKRNEHYRANPQRAGKKIWGQELVIPSFDESNNCKDPRYRGGPH